MNRIRWQASRFSVGHPGGGAVAQDASMAPFGTPGDPASTDPASGAGSRPAVRTLGDLARRLAADGLAGELRGDPATEILGVSQDSRSLEPGDLFLAWRGTHADAHGFVAGAGAAGAAAALVESFVEEAGLPQLRVPDGRRGAALAAMHLAGNPAGKLVLTAVTGTNGKTTVAWIVRQLLATLDPGRPAAALGTLGLIGSDGSVRPGTGGLTTPGPVAVASWLRELVDEGTHHLVLEASSHALVQGRLDALRFEAVGFTNLTRDHLDYHPTLEAYREAKAHLLTLVGPEGEVVVHAGDPAWAALRTGVHRVRAVGLDDGGWSGLPDAVRGDPGRQAPVLRASRVTLGPEGSRFLLVEEGEAKGTGALGTPVTLPLLGRFNVENALVAAGLVRALGFALDAIGEALETVTAPPGRMEVAGGTPVPVILDYAHTPDALARALETLRPLVSGRLIAVFGAGGDRDRAKRPEMGRVAARLADLLVLTSDNPRTEDPERILDDIVAGVVRELPASEGRLDGGWVRVTDRREAMARALELARPGDVVLLAGKGHETYQVVGTERRPFDERQVLRELLEARA